MKRKYRKLLAALILALSVMLCSVCLSACGPGDDTTEDPTVTLTYSGSTLADATVNTAYSVSIASAQGADGIAYDMKSGSSLPAGLFLTNGTISGTPTAAVSKATFIIVASKTGAASVEAKFTLTVLAEGEKTFKMEAEYTDVSKLLGGGISGAAGGLNMLQTGAKASNGWFIGFTHKKNLTITFNFTSDVAVSAAEMRIGLGTELGAMEMNRTSSLSINVNGTALSYAAFQLPANSSQIGNDFKEYAISSTFPLLQGANTITLTVLENTYCNGGTGGPLFDCLTIQSTANLSWTPLTDNIT